jgi:hypothetical protein
MVCPRILFAALNGLLCNTTLAVGASGLATQRITSSAWKSNEVGSMRPSA